MCVGFLQYSLCIECKAKYDKKIFKYSCLSIRIITGESRPCPGIETISPCVLHYFQCPACKSRQKAEEFMKKKNSGMSPLWWDRDEDKWSKIW